MTRRLLVCVFALCLAGCGGDDGNAPVPDGPPGSGPDAGSGGGERITVERDGVTVDFDMFVAAQYSSADQATSVYGSRVDGMINSTLGLTFKMQAPGTYPCTQEVDGNVVSYVGPNAAGGPGVFDSWGASNCTITITAYGAVGELVEGTFAATVDDGATETHVFTNGVFSVTRAADM